MSKEHVTLTVGERRWIRVFCALGALMALPFAISAFFSIFAFFYTVGFTPAVIFYLRTYANPSSYRERTWLRLYLEVTMFLMVVLYLGGLK